jgi:hypothetical protein
MLSLRAMVLGRMGWTTSPHPRACALSCPSPATYGPGYSLLNFPGPHTLGQRKEPGYSYIGHRRAPGSRVMVAKGPDQSPWLCAVTIEMTIPSRSDLLAMI